jgi:hypothetical protein
MRSVRQINEQVSTSTPRYKFIPRDRYVITTKGQYKLGIYMTYSIKNPKINRKSFGEVSLLIVGVGEIDEWQDAIPIAEGSAINFVVLTLETTRPNAT